VELACREGGSDTGDRLRPGSQGLSAVGSFQTPSPLCHGPGYFNDFLRHVLCAPGAKRKNPPLCRRRLTVALHVQVNGCGIWLWGSSLSTRLTTRPSRNLPSVEARRYLLPRGILPFALSQLSGPAPIFPPQGGPVLQPGLTPGSKTSRSGHGTIPGTP